MPLNPALWNQLEAYGVTNEHLLQLIALCERPPGKATWHMHPDHFVRLEITLSTPMQDVYRMRDLTKMLQKERHE
jgi:hypothetical protein